MRYSTVEHPIGELRLRHITWGHNTAMRLKLALDIRDPMNLVGSADLTSMTLSANTLMQVINAEVCVTHPHLEK